MGSYTLSQNTTTGFESTGASQAKAKTIIDDMNELYNNGTTFLSGTRMSSADTSLTYIVDNPQPTYVGGSWTASVGADGVTTLVGTGVKSPIGTALPTVTIRPASGFTLVAPNSLTINVGATVDRMVLAGTSTSPINNTMRSAIRNHGTLTNSVIAYSTYADDSASISKNNSFIQTSIGNGVPGPATLLAGRSDHDIFYISGNNSVVHLNSYGDFYTPMDRANQSIGSNGYFDSAITVGDGTTSKVFTTGPEVTLGCFLAGSMIQTVNGLVAIEDIQVGDQVVTYHNDQEELRSIIWTGSSNFQVRTYLSEDEAGYPVRIAKNAIAEGVPSKDLLVTPEHSILIDGQFILARMLVNDSSIIYDHSIKEYTFYHIETEEHSIISANNVLTESYLDTGNRSNFVPDDNLVSLANKKKEWNTDSAAPLVTTREIVEPIFMQLAKRAKTLGFASSSQDVITINDSGLQLLTNSGVTLEAISQSKGRFVFKLPKNTTQVRLISRTSRPSQAIGPYVDDRRNLGVLIGNVTLLESHNTFSIMEHFTSNNLQGWDVQEQSACRWTNGNALLNIETERSNSVRILVVQVLAAGPYILEEEVAEQQNIA